MDKYIMTVVKQMVQLAALDDDLKAEIDALDSNGLSLLHYCCLYNLNSLIPVLLARGASVDKRAYNGVNSTNQINNFISFLFEKLHFLIYYDLQHFRYDVTASCCRERSLCGYSVVSGEWGFAARRGQCQLDAQKCSTTRWTQSNLPILMRGKYLLRSSSTSYEYLIVVVIYFMGNSGGGIKWKRR